MRRLVKLGAACARAPITCACLGRVCHRGAYWQHNCTDATIECTCALRRQRWRSCRCISGLCCCGRSWPRCWSRSTVAGNSALMKRCGRRQRFGANVADQLPCLRRWRRTASTRCICMRRRNKVGCRQRLAALAHRRGAYTIGSRRSRRRGAGIPPSGWAIGEATHFEEALAGGKLRGAEDGVAAPRGEHAGGLAPHLCAALAERLEERRQAAAALDAPNCMRALLCEWDIIIWQGNRAVHECSSATSTMCAASCMPRTAVCLSGRGNMPGDSTGGVCLV